ncbi:esterase [Scytonema sp. UIC 10036]|uniref:alpha/beta hydrolase-fold protein n=1 Tax=Scytonema sp. UIC 10036 TaxID=2304196 RepID=UPI0012DAE1A7|nr:alpha/beta hydrolase-fold protein [Scytonema sp. UIC 10036]MUG96949.1 esterase [Scytonema sp. UIC 10036]
MKVLYPTLITLAILLPLPVYAQPEEGRPAPSNVPGQQYPYIYSDGRVTFQFKAPEAKRVQVVGRDGKNILGKKPIDLIRGEDGVWKVTTPPVPPGFHYYQLIVDGTPVNDPSSQTYFGWGQASSGLEVPDPQLDFYEAKSVPHGEVRLRWYHSRVTRELRRVYVYTPPGYDANTKRRYPVLYLQHGAGESERAWTEQGRANFILDNLIAVGKAKPMIVVMDNGYARKPNVPLPPDSWGIEAFEEVVTKDLVPLIDSTYRTIANRQYRAIAGLSMGGGQALQVGLNNLDKFAWVGGFSSFLKDFDVKTSYSGVFINTGNVNLQLRLLWLGCDTKDDFYIDNKNLHEALEKAGIKHVWVTGSGGHEWQVWRRYLYTFVPQLFHL